MLKMIGEASHQARAYREILTSFSEAILKHRQQISLESRRTVQHYMDHVLVVRRAETDQNQNRLDQVDDRFDLPLSSLSEARIQFNEFSDPQSEMTLEDFQINWAELDMQFID